MTEPPVYQKPVSRGAKCPSERAIAVNAGAWEHDVGKDCFRITGAMPAQQTGQHMEGVTEIRIRGKNVLVPSIVINNTSVIVTGKLLKMAGLHDEELVEGDMVTDPQLFVRTLRQRKMADIFSFAQKITNAVPSHDYHFEWDNAAVVPTTVFKEWWENRLPQESRKNVRRAEKRGVEVREVPFNDELIQGIQGIYNESPVRQGRPFWHFGKPFEAVKEENGTYLERSDFIGAFFNDELIGFIKIIYADNIGRLIQIVSKNTHQDKRPMNALLAGAVQLCERKGVSFLVYGKYAYDGMSNSPLAEFKRRNGFEEIRFPRYFVPITFKGEVALRCRLHRGVKSAFPRPVLNRLLNLRSRFYEIARSTKLAKQNR